jgi:hypothetical protein
MNVASVKQILYASSERVPRADWLQQGAGMFDLARAHDTLTRYIVQPR